MERNNIKIAKKLVGLARELVHSAIIMIGTPSILEQNTNVKR